MYEPVEIINEETAKLKIIIAELNDTATSAIDPLKRINPGVIRKNTETNLTLLDQEASVNTLIFELNDSIEKIKDVVKVANTSIISIQELKRILNIARLGTLEGLTRSAIKTHGVKTADEMMNVVLSQSYNELPRVKYGGKSRKKKIKNKNKFTKTSMYYTVD